MRKTLTILGFAGALALSGCTKGKLYGLPGFAKPMPFLFKQMPEGMSPTYQYGWKHGCESGLATMTNGLFRSAYRFKIDPAMRHHALVTDPGGQRSDAPDYYKAWKDSYEYCRSYAYSSLRIADERTTQPNAVPTTLATLMGAHNINKRGLLNMWGPGKDDHKLIANFGQIGNDVTMGDGGHMNWDFSDGYFSGSSMKDVWNWDLRPEEGFVW